MNKIIFEENQLLVEIDEAEIAWVYLNAPDTLNVLTPEMARGAEKLYRKLKAQNPRVIVFSGVGRAFSAGGDLAYLTKLSKQKAKETEKQMHKFYRAFLNPIHLQIPTIAHINGHAVGAGFALALGCDLRFAVSTAKVGFNFVRLGINPGMASEFVTLRDNSPLIREMLLTGNLYSVAEKRLSGLFNSTGGEHEVIEAVRRAAETIAHNSPQAIRITLKLLRRNAPSLDAVLSIEAKGQGLTMTSGQIGEGILAQKKRLLHWFKK